MAKKREQRTESETTQSQGRSLAWLVLIGATSAAWAQYLWSELIASRSGGTPFCAFGQSDCGALWDGSFASAIHTYTGLPVAAWGVAWGWLALLLPLGALVYASQGRPLAPLDAAIRWVAFGGLGGLVILLLASAMEGLFCTNCALTYLLTIAYVLVVWRGLQRKGVSDIGGGLPVVALSVVAVYLVLLYPGLNTPGSVVGEGEKALAAVAEISASASSPQQGMSNPQIDAQLADLIQNLPPQSRQALADSIYLYKSSPVFPLERPRALQGAADAGVRITEFTDPLCSHCATLHGTLVYLRTLLAPDSFAVDSRQFPLDGNCNSHLPIGGSESVRCLAARARICLESSPDSDDFAKAVYDRQSQLTPELVFQAAAPFANRSELESCIASPETATKLAADVDYAWRYQPDGTPLVLVNGRRGASFGPFLYAMVLTGGRTDHPAFASLPAANPNAHIH